MCSLKSTENIYRKYKLFAFIRKCSIEILKDIKNEKKKYITRNLIFLHFYFSLLTLIFLTQFSYSSPLPDIWNWKFEFLELEQKINKMFNTTKICFANLYHHASCFINLEISSGSNNCFIFGIITLKILIYIFTWIAAKFNLFVC